ncbi:hypothetical protein EPN96_07080 [bacterium]|nr:MAG: hypothetical protein EPN96_07080 [bacterium]
MISGSRHSLSTLTLLIAIFLAAFAPSASAVQILSPPFNTALGDDFVTVIGKDQPGKTIAWQHIRPTGLEQAEAVAGPSGIFNFSAKLDPGINRFNVSGTYIEVYFVQDKDPVPSGFIRRHMHSRDISQCSDCHDENMKLVEGGQPYVCLACHVVVSQNPENDADPMSNNHFKSTVATCTECHEPHLSQNVKLMAPQKLEPCKSCHAKNYAGAKNHAAFEEGGCMACHDPHYTGFPYRLYKGLRLTCQECHSQAKSVPDKKFHPPSANESGKFCDDCHDPHGTTPRLIKGDKNDLCVQCHPKVLKEGHGKELKGCAKCHDPHREIGTRQLRADFPAGCEECHDGYRDGATVHQPVKEGCQSCHSPHKDGNLAKAKEKCLQCHNFKKDLEVSTLHGNLPLTVEQCLTCHPVHDSSQTKLVKGKIHFPLTQGKCDACHGQGAAAAIKIKDVTAKCNVCHTTLKDLQQSGQKVHSPVSDDGCTACHNPHMSVQKAYLAKPMEKLCRECHDDVPQAGNGKELHPAAKDCADCHKPHGGENKKFLVKAKDLCLDCHDNPVTGASVVHAALDEGCTACHDAHAGFGKKLLKAKIPGLCTQCHTDPAKGKVVHTAMDEGCNACHKPHATNTKKLLNAAGDKLCLNCHTVPGKEGKIPHTGLEEGCTSCHAPHSSENKNLVKAKGNALCFNCHSDPAKSGKVHTALDEGCSSCHKPHGSDQKNLLTSAGDKLCFACHKDPAKDKKVRHDALDEGCTQCHKPHSSAEYPLLKKPVNTLCKECHSSHKKHVLDAKSAKDYPGPAPFPVSGNELSCAGCHNPHASNEAHLYAKPQKELCNSCH